ncbi:hypothetical protein CPB83DRAFT_877730 [Crepidotus variabilis]|uniref:(4-O-methyl)-D-glucuronate--lignin esterase n=1 Tax=Crepidotus variabilis TaxID=179855 RepID=A0A9P6JKQ9_9AGAR|nr:hypothetical protein CPB83DRAFT_877730 [Crepidotus variabilis]
MAIKVSLITLALAVSVFADQPLWGQCGGMNYSGSTTCASGSACIKMSDWYSQCQPGSSSPTADPPAPSNPTVTPPAPPVTTTVDAPTSTAAPPSTGAPAACSPLPSNITLKSIPKLPDPFTDISGNKITTKAQWACRREEISQLFQKYELGTLPPKPSGLTATYSGGTLSITATEGGKSISFTASISGNTGTKVPAIIGIGGISIPRPNGVAQINFNNDDMAAQQNTGSRGQGKFYTLYGSGHSASSMMAWAWGVGRVIDALEITTGHNIDLTKLAVSGCSRNGKGALVAGAFNERIALTIPQESGSGGAGCWRISDAMMAKGINTQTAKEIVGENVWFSKSFESFVNTIPTLPVDHHLLAALVAPRALLIIDNTGIDWLGPQSVFGCMKTANKVYQALGIADSMGVSQVGNHNHCAFPSNEQGDLTAFINKFLLGQSTNTNIVKTDGANNAGFVENDWVDWTTPTLT